MRFALLLAIVVGCAHGSTEIDVTLSPDMPTTTDALVATVDNQGPKVDFTLRWTKNGEVQPADTGTSIDASETTRGDVWEVDVMVDSSVAAHASTTIVNSPPTAPLIVLPATAGPGDAVACAITNPSIDADGDTITYTAAWTRNAQAFGSAISVLFTSDTIPAGIVADGDSLVCIVTASDGTDSTPSLPAMTMATCVGHPATATTFAFTGTTQPYTMPQCATNLKIEVWGAQGGGPGGGKGGYAVGELDAVAAGQAFVVEVGGMNDYNGGGAGSAMTPSPGGGASDVRLAGGSLADRIIVAGGGGGGPQGDTGLWAGGTGGGGTCGANFCGGGAGTGYGGSGTVGGASGGTGVTTNAHAGGAGGGGLESGGGPSCETYDQPSTCGGGGSLGAGGDGGPSMAHAVCYTTYGGTAGGGGGYYGGGGSAIGFCGGGAGGGGSSWTGALASPALVPGMMAGDGKVVITPL